MGIRNYESRLRQGYGGQVRFKNNGKKGFTLVEVLVVIAIIGILTTLLLPNFTTARHKANDAKRKANLEKIKSALEVYKADQPSKAYFSTSGPVQGASAGSTNVLYDILHPASGNLYLPEFPLDPADPRLYFFYQQADSGRTYVLCAHLEYEGDQDRNSLCSTLPAGTCGGDCNYGITNP